MTTTENKKEFYNALFVSESSEYLNNSNQTVTNLTIKCTNEQFQKYINHEKNKYPTLDHAEIMSIVMEISWNVIKDFELKNCTWNNMIQNDEQAKDDLAMLFYKIKQSLKGQLWLYAADLKQGSINNESVYIHNALDSLDIEMNNMEDGRSLLETVSQSFWTTEEESYANTFMKWFNDNRHEFLTKRQNDFIDVIAGVDLSDGITSLDVSVQTGIDSSNINKLMERIEERTDKAFKKTFNYQQFSLLKDLEGLTDEYEIADWFKKNINEFKFLLKEQEYYKDLRSTLRNKKPNTDIVYLADVLLMDYYEMMKKLHNKQHFYKKQHEVNGFNVKEAIRKHRKNTKNSEVKVYKNGELVRTEKTVEPTEVKVLSFEEAVDALC